jgi:ABC-2 type transport system permease protein
MSANKTLIILEREYLTRVRNKTFILSTFLLPIMMIVFIFGSVFFAVQSVETRKVAVVNDPGFFAKYMHSDSGRVVFDFGADADSTNYVEKGFDGILYLPEGTAARDYLLQSKKQFGLSANEYVERQINKAIENHLLEEQGIEQKMLDSIAEASKGHARLSNKVSDEQGRSKNANAGLAYGIGFGSGILIYITMFIFGSMVMRGVVEEKTNRIAEVIVSSCKPFELMMGKIIGIAGVGLTQFLLWIGLIFILMTSIQFFVPAEVRAAGRRTSPCASWKRRRRSWREPTGH